MTLRDGSVGRAMVPAGASKGTREALELRDATTRFGGLDVLRAVGNVNGEIARAVVGCAADDQAALDAAPDRSGRHTGQDQARRQRDARGVDGRSACGGRVARRAAVRVPRRIDAATLLPMPQIQIFGGGAHAGRRVDIQDFMVVCPGAHNFGQALEWTAEVYRSAGLLMQERGPARASPTRAVGGPISPPTNRRIETLVEAIERAGFVPGKQVAIALDVAASEFGRQAGTRSGWRRARSTPMA